MHPSFVLANRQARILRPVILPDAKIMVSGKTRILERGLLVPAGLNQDIQHFVLAIYRPPQIVCVAIDLHYYFVQVPAPLAIETALAYTPFPDPSGEHRPKAVPPEPYRLTADVDATLVEQILGVS